MPQWIDMRDEMRRLIEGDRRTVSQGYWIVLRVMRIGQYLVYWDMDRREAVGGPKWLYDDLCVRCIGNPGASLTRVPSLREGGNIIITGGTDSTTNKVIAIEWGEHLPRLPLSGEDVVYEIDKFASVDQPDPPFRVTDRFKILDVLKEHGDYGRAELIYLLVQRIHGES